MFVEEILQGRYNAPPAITEFENVDRYDQLIVTGPIEVRSMCAHHLMPIFGQAFIGVLPSPEGKIIGLSSWYDSHAVRRRLREIRELACGSTAAT